MKVLVTGGAGYIGSHTLIELIQAGNDILVLDNFCNSHEESLGRVELITNKKLQFIRGDVRDQFLLERIFSENKVDAVVHFAGLKAVGDSVKKPLEYYDTNFSGSLKLLHAMEAAGVFKFVFSSSATVYGIPSHVPIYEDSPAGTLSSPYGRSKLMVEDALRDAAISDPRWRIAILRYFNPIGAHSSGLLGENPEGTPNNLLPYISQVAVGKLKKLSIFGNDYPTKDGTGVRDYIHVMDLAKGHLRALDFINNNSGVGVWNLGTGVGYSVMEIISTFERITSVNIPYEISPRRDGDVAECWSDPSKAERELGWKAELDLCTMISDLWRWQSKNPTGL